MEYKPYESDGVNLENLIKALGNSPKIVSQSDLTSNLVKALWNTKRVVDNKQISVKPDTFHSDNNMPQALSESETYTYTVLPGREYVFSVAGAWDSMTITLQWSDGTTDVAFSNGSFTDDGGLVFVAPTDTIKVVSGADATNSGALVFDIYGIAKA